MQPQHLGDLFELYKNHVEQKGDTKTIPLVQSALLRFTVPGWGGPLPKGKKMTFQETRAGLEFLKQIKLEQVQNALSIQEQVFEQLKIDKERRRQPRCYLKNFIDWSTEQWIRTEIEAKKSPQPYRFHSPKGQRRKPLTKLMERGQLKAYALGKVEGDFINPHLQAELDELDVFLQTSLKCKSKATREGLTQKSILLMLGWLCHSKGELLEDVRLSSLIPIINLCPKIEDFADSFEAYSVATIKAQRTAKDSAEEVIQLCEEYFLWRKKESKELSTSSKNNVVCALIRLAKFLYKNQTDKGMHKHYEDIPVVNRLKIFAIDIQERGSKAPVVPHSKKFLKWTEIQVVLEKLRFEADLEENWFWHKRSNKYEPHKRRITAVATCYQRFLMLAFLVLIPPDRQRTFRELKIGNNLMFGTFEDRRFIPQERMENPSDAKWYIFLGEDEYKTWDTYGEWYVPVPNTIFLNGKVFYQYIERWINELREVFKPNHDYFFTGKYTKKSLNTHQFYQVIRAIFVRFTGIPVNPHELRHIYSTHLRDIRATQAEIASSAFIMKHSEKTASEKYTHQKQEAKLSPGLELMERINSNFLNIKLPHPKPEQAKLAEKVERNRPSSTS
jgi:hypothetical protein